MSPSPPRGMARSINCGMARNLPTAARSVVLTSCTASAGRPTSSAASIRISTIAWLEWIASFPPRRMTALPDLTQIAAASAVTFGRDS